MRPGLVLQPPGGVDEDHVGLLLGRRHARPRRRRSPGRTPQAPRTVVHPDALAPGGELLGGSGAEGVGGAEHDVLVLGDEDPGELAHGGGLAGAVDARR